MPSAEREAWSQKTFRRIPWSPEIQLVCWEARSSWRRRRDSNPRYGNTPYGGLANRWFQPLTHVSGSSKVRGYISGFRIVQPLRPWGSRTSLATQLNRNSASAAGAGLAERSG